ncbi:MAG: SGNH/GDSL hydrolase family protein [Clostridia bacterium]|nr:SGNH/GDSL hydrolase family protein [Clostridia bacterium]
MKKLLLIGDSIRMNYDKYVAQALEGQVQVFTPYENCRFAAYTYYSIGDWEHKQRFGEDVDVIHWNVGLHDVIHFHYDDVMTPPEIYGYYLGRIIWRLHDVYPHAKQIFALSTPGRDEKYVLPWIVRKNKEIDAINQVAKQVMAEHGVPVNDLASVVRRYEPDDIYADATHYNYTGSVILAKAVLEAVCPLLGVTPDLSKIHAEDETRSDILQ